MGGHRRCSDRWCMLDGAADDHTMGEWSSVDDTGLKGAFTDRRSCPPHVPILPAMFLFVSLADVYLDAFAACVFKCRVACSEGRRSMVNREAAWPLRSTSVTPKHLCTTRQSVLWSPFGLHASR